MSETKNAAVLALIEAAEELALFPDWEDRFSHIIELGRTLPCFPEDARTEANRVRGCASQVWLVAESRPDGAIVFLADSDAHIVRGLIALLLRIYSERSPADILSLEPQAVAHRLGLGAALTSQRSNGLASMVERIRAFAKAAQA